MDNKNKYYVCSLNIDGDAISNLFHSIEEVEDHIRLDIASYAGKIVDIKEFEKLLKYYDVYYGEKLTIKCNQSVLLKVDIDHERKVTKLKDVYHCVSCTTAQYEKCTSVNVDYQELVKDCDPKSNGNVGSCRECSPDQYRFCSNEVK